MESTQICLCLFYLSPNLVVLLRKIANPPTLEIWKKKTLVASKALV
jgi:hypothetical protein